jgi:cysteine desulfurase
MIYFDHNSTTFLSSKALKAINDVSSLALNPSSLHSCGRKARELLEQAREQILANFNASKKYDLLFTSSGTESNNLVLRNFYDGQILISAIEHLSVYEHLKHNQNISVIPVNSNGILDLECLKQQLQNLRAKDSKKILVSIIYANNETGVLQDLPSISAITKEYGALLHSDFSQAFGKIACDLDSLEIDFITISAHKFGGPSGIAGLFYKKNLNLAAQMLGGRQEKGMRSGTQNVAAAVGMAAASYQENLLLQSKYVETLRNKLEDLIQNMAPTAVIASKNAARLPNTSMLSMPGVESQLQVISFDLRGFAISNGSACSSGRIGPSHVIQNYGYAQDLRASFIRVSLASSNTQQEIELFSRHWWEIFQNSSKNSSLKSSNF